MANVGYATLSVIPSLRGFDSAIKNQIRGPIQSVSGQAGADAGQSFGSRFTSGLLSVAGAAGKIIAGGFAIGAAGAGALTASLLKVGISYNTLEQSSTAAFKTILGSTQAAVEMQDQIREFAKTSPFPRQAFIEGTQQLLGFGVSAKQIIPTLSAIQDSVAAVGGGANEISQITYALAQVKGQGKLTGETLNQLGQFGIDAAAILGKQFGKTGAEIRDMASKPGGIPADQVFDPLVQGLTEKFGGAAENVKATFVGSVDRIKGAFRDIGSDLAEPFVSKAGGGAAVGWANQVADAMRSIQANVIPALADALGGLAFKIQPFVDKFTDFVKGLSADDVTNFVAKIGTAFDKIGPLIAGAGAALGTLGAGGLPFIGPLVSSLNPLVAGLIAVGLASPEVRDAFKSLVPIATGLAKTLSKSLKPVLPVIAKAIGRVAGFVGDLLASGIVALAPVFEAIVEAVVPLIPIFVDLVDAISGPLLDAVGELAPVLGDLAATMGGALADAITTIAPSLPGLFENLGDVAVVLGTDLADALSALSPLLPAFGELVVIAADLIAKVPPDVLAAIVLGFVAFKELKGVSDTVSSFSGGIKKMIDVFSDFGLKSDLVRTHIGMLLTEIGKVSKAGLQKILIKLGVDFATEAGADAATGAAGSAAGGAFAPKLRELSKQIGTAVASFFSVNPVGIVVAITAIGYSIAFPDDIPILRDKGPKFDLNLKVFGKSINELTQAAVDTLADMWNTAWDQAWKTADLGDIFGAVEGALSKWFDTLGSFNIMDTIGDIGDFLFDDLKLGDFSKIDSFFDDVTEGITDALDGGIRDLIDDIRGWIGDTLGSINFDWVGEVIGGIFGGGGSDTQSASGPGGPSVAAVDPSFLDTAFEGILNWIKDLPNKIADALPNPINWLLDKGIQVIGGFLTGIGQAVPLATNFFVTLPSRIIDWIGDTFPTLLQRGIDIITGFLSGIVLKAAEVTAFFTSLPGRIVGWIGDLFGQLVPKGIEVISGFLAGLRVKIGEVETFVRSIPGKVRAAFPDASGILEAIGRQIIGGLISGLKAGMGPLGTFLGGIAGFVKEHKPIKTDHLMLVPAGQAIMRGLNNGLKDGLGDIEKTLKSTTALIGGHDFGSASVGSFAAPSVSAQDLRALQEITINPQTAGRSAPSVVIESLHAWNGKEAAVAIADEQSWRDRTTGKD